MARFTCGKGELQTKIPPSMYYRYLNKEKVITANTHICMKMQQEMDPRRFLIAPPDTDDDFHCVITDAFNSPKRSPFKKFTQAVDTLISEQPTYSQEDYILVTTDIYRYRNKYSCEPLNMTKLYNLGVTVWVVGAKEAEFVTDRSKDVAEDAVEDTVDEAVSNEVDRVEKPEIRKNKKPKQSIPNITELAVSVEKSAHADADDDEGNVDETELAAPIEKSTRAVTDDDDGGIDETSAFLEEKQPPPVSDNEPMYADRQPPSASDNKPMYADKQPTVDEYNDDYDTYDDYDENQLKGDDETPDTAKEKTIDISEIEKLKSKENKKTVPLNNKSGNKKDEYDVKFIEPTLITDTADNEEEENKSISQFHMALIIVAGFLLFAFIVITCKFIYMQLCSKYSRGDRAFISGSRTVIPVRA